MDKEEIKKEIRREFAKTGGDKTLEKYGKDHYSRMAKKGWENRKKKKADLT